ncbi:protein ABHD11-like [Chelonus insularis]|uniref:protein ABHD11-like n=1 Tax=Chelonus insularis TaxID=460826 RepID=UPI00158B7828|nr:protein ABHD11-like [Chelonus insularis]XP_034940080.1 protein ABHD11-like [Chelonus insularis]
MKKFNPLNYFNNIKLISSSSAYQKIISRCFSKSSTMKNAVKLSTTLYTSPNTAPLNELSPVIIMHGLFGSKNNWNSLAKAINQQTNRQVITVDARNHGESPHSSEMTYTSMAEDVNQLIHTIGVDKSILIGHSMGGAVMMCTALNHPNLTDKLIIVDMSPIKTSPSLYEMTKIIDALQRIKFENYHTLSEARKSTDKLLSSTIESVSLRQFLLTNISEITPGQYKWRVNLPVIAENFSTNIAVFPQLIPKLKNQSFDGKTLFIAGGNSDYIRVEDEENIKKLFSNAKIHYIANAGHWVQSDNPTEFLKVACSFINSDR